MNDSSDHSVSRKIANEIAPAIFETYFAFSRPTHSFAHGLAEISPLFWRDLD